MFGLGMGEILIILVLALLLLGPTKLPEAAKQLGKGLREFRKTTDELKTQFETELYADDSKPARPTAVGSPQVVPAGQQPVVPPGGVPTAAPGEVPVAAADNVPGLEAALAEPKPTPPVTAPGTNGT